MRWIFSLYLFFMVAVIAAPLNLINAGAPEIAPSAADKSENTITPNLYPPGCAGSSPENGQSSYFFGLASLKPARHVTENIEDTLGGKPHSTPAPRSLPLPLCYLTGGG
jgi:hypothetical protein